MTRRRLFPSCLILLLTVLFVPIPGHSQEGDYKEYKPASPARLPYFTLTYDSRRLLITVERDSVTNRTKTFPLSDVTLSARTVTAGGKLLFDSLGMHFEDSLFSYDLIRDIEIAETSDGTALKFFRSGGEQSRVQMIRRGNRISYSDSILVSSGEFVRGAVFSVLGNLHIAGEINRDVISLFGQIVVSPSAVVRGDLATVKGSIVIAKTAQVYGDTYKADSRRLAWRHRFFRQGHPVQPDARLSYNRVDGFAPYLSVSYQDRDSLLPSARAEIGYAFESSRWRLSLSAEQPIWRTRPLWIGAEYYRHLASDDDWLLPDWENSIYAALATEDFKDFYEAEGGTLYFRFIPVKSLTSVIRYRNEQTNWLPAHRHLSSVFGGEKIFPENFATVPSPYRDRGIAEIDTGTSVTLTTSLQYDTRHDDSIYTISAWNLSGWLEWSSTRFNSDFNYRRWMIDLRRYQAFRRYSTILLRGVLGSSDGYLPMNRRFFLGGPGTTYGYERKEYFGTRFWMLNAEYRFQIPKAEVAFGAFWDIGQIANDQKLNGDVEVRNSLGLATYFGDSFRLSVARRLDRADNSYEIYMRLMPAF